MDMIISSAPHASLLALRATSREMMHKCDAKLVKHIVIHTDTVYNGKLADDTPVTIRSPAGRLPMFMTWSDHLDENLWDLPYTKSFGSFRLGPSDWFELPVPKVLYPGLVEEMYARNWLVRARRADVLVQHTQVVDIVGPIPLARFRELCSAFRIAGGLHCTLRFLPDCERNAPWSPTLDIMTNGQFHRGMEQATAKKYESIQIGELDTLVFFHNILYRDNIQTIEHGADSVWMAPLFVCAPRKLVIHFTMDSFELQDYDRVEHQLPWQIYERKDIKDIVLIFQHIDLGPQRDPDVEPYSTNCLRRILDRLADPVWFPSARITVVNAEAIFPQVLGLSDQATPEQVKEKVSDRFWQKFDQSTSRQREKCSSKFRSISLDQYAAEVGPETFERETDGYLTYYQQWVGGSAADSSDA